MSTLAAEAVMERPLSESFQKLRRAQRALVASRRRNKVRVSFQHMGGSRSSPVSAQQDAKKKLQIRQPRLHDAKLEQEHDGDRLSKDRTADASWSYGQCRTRAAQVLGDLPGTKYETDARYSLMHKAEPRPYRDELPRSPFHRHAKPEGSRLKPYWEHPEYAHVGSIENAYPAEAGSQILRYQLDLDSSQFVIKRRPVEEAWERPPRNSRYSVVRKQQERQQGYPSLPRAAVPAIRRNDSANPKTTESMRRSLTQQYRLSSLAMSAIPNSGPNREPGPAATPNSAIEAVRRVMHEVDHTDPPLRPSSQRVELRRFTRELEKYAVVSGAAGKLPVTTPTVTSSATSLNTMREFLPYREQFQVAGLAVTSADQASNRKRDGRSRSNHKLPAFHPAQIDGSAGYNKMHDLSSSSSTDTIVPFRELGERDALALVVAEETAKNKETHKRATRKILPWLRRKHQDFSKAKHSRAHDHDRAAAGSQYPTHLYDQKLPPDRALNKPDPQDEYRIADSLGQRRAPVDSHPPPPYREAHSAPLNDVPSNSVSLPRPRHSGKMAWAEKEGASLLLRATRSQEEPDSEETLSFKNSRVSNGRVIPPTIQEEPEPSSEKQPRMNDCPQQATIVDEDDATPTNDTGKTLHTKASSGVRRSVPALPETWMHAKVSTPSSFERTLDDVVNKLETMDAIKLAAKPSKVLRPRSKRISVQNKRRSAESSKKNSTCIASSPSKKLMQASAIRRKRMADAETWIPNESQARVRDKTRSRTRQRLPSTPGLLCDAKVAVAGDQRLSDSAAEKGGQDSMTMAMDPRDRDISDRDVLLGLKLAISAACDERLDAWIRIKTGLRLRRFLEDLKTFAYLDEAFTAATNDDTSGHVASRPRRSLSKPNQSSQQRKMVEDNDNHNSGTMGTEASARGQLPRRTAADRRSLLGEDRRQRTSIVKQRPKRN